MNKTYKGEILIESTDHNHLDSELDWFWFWLVDIL